MIRLVVSRSIRMRSDGRCSLRSCASRAAPSSRIVALASWTTPRSFILPARRLPTDASIGPFAHAVTPRRGGAIRSYEVHGGNADAAPGPRGLAPQSAQADRTWMARSPFGPVWTSKLTASPPLRRSKSRESVRPSLWKKYSFPSGAAMKPKPRSEMTRLTVPVAMARTPFLLEQMYGAGPVREETSDQAKATEGTADAQHTRRSSASRRTGEAALASEVGRHHRLRGGRVDAMGLRGDRKDGESRDSALERHHGHGI